MAYCEKCGQPLENGVRFCASCGAPTAHGQSQTVYNAPVQQYGNPEQPIDGEYSQADIEANKVMAVLAYIGILVLVPIFAAKESKFARFHANQGLVLMIAELALSFITGLIKGIVGSGLITSLLSLVNLVFVVFAILGIVNALKGEAKPLPVIGEITLLK